MKLHKKALSLALGYLFAGMHLLWVLAAWFGFAQPLADLWHTMHFIGDRHEIMPASFWVAVMGIVAAYLIGYLSGWVLGLLLERFEK